MRAQDGRLSLNQSYKLVATEYHGKQAADEISFNFESCENCGNIISHIMIVQGSEDNKTYRIGTDCAAVMVGINPDELKQAKKELASKAKIAKWIMTKAESFIILDGIWYGFEFDNTQEAREEFTARRREYSPEYKYNPHFENWKYRGKLENRISLIESTKKPIYYLAA